MSKRNHGSRDRIVRFGMRTMKRTHHGGPRDPRNAIVALDLLRDSVVNAM